MSKGILNEKEIQYAIALQKIESNKDKVFGKNANLHNVDPRHKPQSINYQGEIQQLRSKVDKSIQKMQETFVEKKIEIERSYNSYQNLIKDLSLSMARDEGPNKSEILMKEVRDLGVFSGSGDSRRRAQPRDL